MNKDSKVKNWFYTLVLATIVVVILVATGHTWIVVAAFVLLVAVFFSRWAFFPQRALTVNRNRYLHLRLRMRLHPGKGHLTALGITVRFGRVAMFRKSKRLRPDLTMWQRWRSPDAYSAELGKAHLWRRVRIDMQTQTLLLAPPRTGKTGMLAARILHHEGSVVATSSQPDLLLLTSGARMQMGSRVHVLNPQALGGIASTFRWDIVAGCQDAATAIRRADALVSAVPTGGSDGSNDWFAAKAGGVLRAFLMAAALGGYDFRQVSQWVLRSNVQEPAAILDAAGRTEFAAALHEMTGKAERTAGSVLMFATRAIQFAVVPELMLSVLPAAGEGLDLEAVIRHGESVYLLAGAVGNDTPLSGLMSALCSELHAVAMRVAADSPGGRLPVPCLLALDEIVQCAPGLPVARFAADGGGRGIAMVVIAHSTPQLRERYGRDTTDALLAACSCKVVFGGTSDPDTLKWLEQMCGQVALREHGHDAHARHPVMAAEMVRELLDGWALVVSQNAPPVIVRTPRAWKDTTYRRLRRRGEAVATLTPAAPPKAMANGHAPTRVLNLPELAPVAADWMGEDK